MNFHYIDYMIRECRGEELEACERQRPLNSVGYSQTALIRKGFSHLIDAFRRLSEKWSLTHRRPYPYGSMFKVVTRIRRDTR